ncbi:MAG TPA: LysM peptidoglycan-binding domain-containing protein [Candidatus Binataceae bacterium]|nr:LysM peptidoglycan-binding domain-containing protein [Candidatus Binataceae bacterium]
MTNWIWRPFGGIGALALAALVAISLAGVGYSAPSEVDIGASGPPTRRRSTPQVPRPAPAIASPQAIATPSVASPPAEPSSSVSGEQSRPEEPPAGPVSEAAPENTPAPPSGLVSQPRASFPYTVRSGDTLGSIASVFGVAVTDLTRANRLREDTELYIGQTLRVPNPFLARERELSSEIDRLSTEKKTAEEREQQAVGSVAGLHQQVDDLTASNNQYAHELRTLPWWRGATVMAAAAAALMLGAMMVALFEWWVLRSRFRAVAEMNESLRRLDYKYKAALAKAELRLQQLYGRRRRGIQDGQERTKIPEETEIEQLNRQLKEVLERHLERLGPSGEGARRARWRERIAGIGSPVEARSIRR